ncbi:tlde1 domain-containing protein [Agrobacterium sp. lyk4-40-TYG-31]|uniref:tlde1 domain-containing protein n=1 Tax=Agrobacterium sp. lyk4-40-TYG-31 TaxID=3040276 RepID=UPI00254D59E5|nr:tlde1 domain-containing protein [Agrobacterium sp. lyk4-40-TYG-31]
MASSVVACKAARARSASRTKKPGASGFSGLTAILGGGVLAGVCAITAFASLHGMAQASHGVGHFDTMVVSGLDRFGNATTDAVARNVHIRKFSRLSENGQGSQKGIRLAAEHHIGAKAFADRFGAGTALDAKGRATAEALAALRPSAIVDSALGRSDENPELAMLETQAKEHPAFEVALGKPQTTADAEIDLLPETVPLPSFRPKMADAADVEPTPRPASPALAEKQLAAAPVPTRTPAPAAPATNTMVAFARPDNPMRETKMDAVPWPDRGNGTAIYDISAGVVHMPGGEKLEAHSGIGKMRDNPDFVHVKMRGATPPSSYRLTMRESLFHGVEAIRLTPENGIKPHGRDGLLAHTYMLARRGESNGCVVFKDYTRFLAAFKRGEVKRIVVVPKLSGRPAMTASGSKSGGKTLFGMFSRSTDS